jgi:hypothetical protein
MLPVAPVRVNTHLALAIVVTVLCCLPFGIVGIVHAAQVNAKAQAGDLAGAQEASRKAKLWSLWGLGLGVGAYVLYFVVAIVAAMAEGKRL